MNRRTVLLGLGTAGIASGTIFGSGAFTRIESERQLTVEVTGDDQAALQLDPNDELDGVTLSGDPAVLTVDLDDINVDSTLSLGDPDDPEGDEAFTITNNTGGAGFTSGFSIEVSAETELEETLEFLFEDGEEEIADLFDASATLEFEESLAIAIRASLDDTDIDETITLVAAQTTDS